MNLQPLTSTSTPAFSGSPLSAAAVAQRLEPRHDPRIRVGVVAVFLSASMCIHVYIYTYVHNHLEVDIMWGTPRRTWQPLHRLEYRDLSGNGPPARRMLLRRRIFGSFPVKRVVSLHSSLRFASSHKTGDGWKFHKTMIKLG